MNNFSERGARADAEVTASEAASYAFCAKAWHLEFVLHLAPSYAAAERRAAGARDHERHGDDVRREGARDRSLARLAIVLLLFAIALAVFAWSLGR